MFKTAELDSRHDNRALKQRTGSRNWQHNQSRNRQAELDNGKGHVGPENRMELAESSDYRRVKAEGQVKTKKIACEQPGQASRLLWCGCEVQQNGKGAGVEVQCTQE